MHRKKSIRTVTSIVCIVISSAVCGQESRGNEDSKSINWDETLTPEEYRILRQCGTEAPFTGEFWDHHEDGIYVCAGCKHPLFDSSTKFESGSGWPSFFDVVDNSFIDTKEDLKYGMRRIELLCHNCQGHLGHVFSDGPPPHGLRYCINSVSLDFTQRDSIAQ
jgi:methionine-R-sulfoxide reductase